MKSRLISAAQQARAAAINARERSQIWIKETRFGRWMKGTQLGRWLSNVPSPDRTWLRRTAGIGLAAWIMLTVWKQDAVEGLDFTVGFITAGIASLVWVRAMEKRRVDSLPNRLTVHFVNPIALSNGNNSFEFVITVWDLPLDSPASIRELAQSGGRQAYEGMLPFSPHRFSLDRQTLPDKYGNLFNNYVACYTLTGPVYDRKPPNNYQAPESRHESSDPDPAALPATIYRVLFPDESAATITLSPVSSIIPHDPNQNYYESDTNEPPKARPSSTRTMISKQRPSAPIASWNDPRLVDFAIWEAQQPKE